MISRRSFLQCFSWVAVAGVPRLTFADAQDPWTAAELMDPAELAKRIEARDQPLHIICVAFTALYKQRHIAGALLAGPGSKLEGIAALRSALEKLNRSDLVVVYCGCCPMPMCPNIRPAYAVLKELKFSNGRVLSLPTNFHTDWAEKGYPVE